MKLRAGIDLGSTAIKAVFVRDREIVWKSAVPTAPGQEAIALKLVEEGLAELSASPEDLEGVAATGYGRNLMSSVDKVVDEVSANAMGVFFLSNEKARTVINIGGQDVKVISFSSEGKLVDFKMNDKCAAGTGRFFEMAARILDTPVYEFGDLCGNADESVSINSTCAVFAESEIVSLLAGGTRRENIIRGLHESVARRISNLMGSRGIEDDLYLDGGSANNMGLVSAIEDEVLRDMYVLPHPQFTVAYGAACSL